MFKVFFPAAAVALLTLASPTTPQASAQGIHIGGRGLHIDIGNPHGRYYSSYGRSHRAFYGGHGVRSFSSNYGYGGYGYSRYGVGRHTARYHDTSHIDYIPGHYVPHGNHYDYIPGRAVWHQEGHWDIGHGHHH